MIVGRPAPNYNYDGIEKPNIWHLVRNIIYSGSLIGRLTPNYNYERVYNRCAACACLFMPVYSDACSTAHGQASAAVPPGNPESTGGREIESLGKS